MKEGIKHTEGKLPYELDWKFIEQLAERMHSNKKNGKYPRDNWKKPMGKQQLLDACTRHFVEIQQGNYEDDGRKFGHIEALATNLMMLNYQLKEFSEDLPFLNVKGITPCVYGSKNPSNTKGAEKSYGTQGAFNTYSSTRTDEDLPKSYFENTDLEKLKSDFFTSYSSMQFNLLEIADITISTTIQEFKKVCKAILIEKGVAEEDLYKDPRDLSATKRYFK